MTDGARIIFYIFIVIAILLAIPVIVIWAINTLFGTGIGYTFWNLLAVLILLFTVNSGSAK